MATCYKCGKADFIEGTGTVDYPQANLPYQVLLVGVPVRRCPACGEESVTVPDAEGLHRALSHLIVNSSRSLLPQEIRFLRKYLDWSAERLGAIMGVDPKTLSRWENGRQKIGDTAERLLRLLVLQQISADVAMFTEQVLLHLRQEAAPWLPPLRLAVSGAGWKQAA